MIYVNVTRYGLLIRVQQPTPKELRVASRLLAKLADQWDANLEPIRKAVATPKVRRRKKRRYQ